MEQLMSMEQNMSMEQLMSNPNYIINQLAKLVQMYISGKSQIITTNAVYVAAGEFSNEFDPIKHGVEPITGLSDTENVTPFKITSGYIALGIYNNTQNTEMFSMVLNSVLGVNDGMIVIQYNDTSPDLNQLLFLKNQEMILTEEVKINLKPNDCIIVAFGKIQQDGKPLRVDIATIGKNFVRNAEPTNMIAGNPNTVHHVQGVSAARKGVFIGLMIILAFAIGVFIYNIANPPKAGFRRRR